jgi:glycosyltransferase involved in cell wall biosynthesis
MVVYVLPHASLCGGVKVIAEHVTGLAARGHTAEVWGLTGDFGWFPRPVAHRLFGSTDELGAALRRTKAAKVATFWITASWVKDNSELGEGYYLIQDEDELTYGGRENGFSYRLGLIPITESEFVTEELYRKYNLWCHNVGIGIDHATFRPLPFIRERFRVLTTARTSSAGPSSLKGWDISQAVLREVVSIEPRASVVTFGQEPVNELGFIPHIHVQSPTDRKLRELYSQSGVFLSCSRHEGFGLPMLEAMACWCPVVCTDAHGNREFCIHGETALVGKHPKELAEYLVELMSNSKLHAELQVLGYRMSQRYQWSTVIDQLERLYQ